MNKTVTNKNLPVLSTFKDLKFPDIFLLKSICLKCKCYKESYNISLRIFAPEFTKYQLETPVNVTSIINKDEYIFIVLSFDMPLESKDSIEIIGKSQSPIEISCFYND